MWLCIFDESLTNLNSRVIRRLFSFVTNPLEPISKQIRSQENPWAWMSCLREAYFSDFLSWAESMFDSNGTVSSASKTDLFVRSNITRSGLSDVGMRSEGTVPPFIVCSGRSAWQFMWSGFTLARQETM